ncbi:MAG TPA: DUF1330 domain-containing protein [Acidimicrobiia bacterium]|nr:DUF1330 domain-containing protein [Acidimicrobiia bacterium]
MAAYVIGEIEVHDADGYEPYKRRSETSIAAHGGRYIVRGGETQAVEGDPPRGRIVVLEFPDLAAARAWYDSAEYTEARPIRHATADGRIFFVDGVPGD